MIKSNKMDLRDLPDELLLKIIHYVDVSGKIELSWLSKVDNRFNRLCKDFTIKKELDKKYAAVTKMAIVDLAYESLMFLTEKKEELINLPYNHNSLDIIRLIPDRAKAKFMLYLFRMLDLYDNQPIEYIMESINSDSS